MMCQKFRQTLLLLTTLLIFGVADATPLQANQPSGTNSKPWRNVVLIVADDLGLQLGCYGDTQTKTPRLDQFAKEATRFTRAYCTTASCSPSRSVILSGLHNHANGQYGLAHADYHFSAFESVLPLPVILEKAGYRTCIVGKHHVAPEYVYKFESSLKVNARNPVKMAATAKSWIQESDAKPFFLYFCPVDPHRSGGPAAYANDETYQGVTAVKFDPEKTVPPVWLPDRPQTRLDWAEYLQSINRLDQGVGSLMDVLKETGHWDDTLVIFTSDNGPPFPGGKTTHYEPGVNLPLLVRDPRQKTFGVVTNAMVNWTDITPTVLDWCGVPTPTVGMVRPMENKGAIAENSRPGPNGSYRFHGKSFLKALAEPHPAGFDEVFLSHGFHELQMYYPMRTVRSGKYKLIYNIAHQLPFPFSSDLYRSATWQDVLKTGDKQLKYGPRTVSEYSQRPQFELYDLEADPLESRNLASEAVHQETLALLKSKLRSWQKETKDPWLSKWEYE